MKGIMALFLVIFALPSLAYKQIEAGKNSKDLEHLQKTEVVPPKNKPEPVATPAARAQPKVSSSSKGHEQVLRYFGLSPQDASDLDITKAVLLRSLENEKVVQALKDNPKAHDLVAKILVNGPLISGLASISEDKTKQKHLGIGIVAVLVLFFLLKFFKRGYDESLWGKIKSKLKGLIFISLGLIGVFAYVFFEEVKIFGQIISSL